MVYDYNNFDSSICVYIDWYILNQMCAHTTGMDVRHVLMQIKI